MRKGGITLDLFEPMTATKLPSLVWWFMRQVPAVYLGLLGALFVTMVVAVAVVLAIRRRRW